VSKSSKVMGRPRREFVFGYEEIAQMCGITRNAVSKAVARGVVQPDDMLSLCCYISAHGNEESRQEIMLALIRAGDYVYRGRPKSHLTKRRK